MPLVKRYQNLIFLLLILLAIYVLLPQLSAFKNSWHLLAHPRLGLAAAAFGFALLTFVAGSATIKLLAFKHLSYLRTLLVQLAASFVNRLLPAGAGALSVNYLYLKRADHKSSQAAAVMGVNNSLGLLGHILIVLVIILAHPADLGLHLRTALKPWIYSLLGIGLITLVVGIIVGGKRVKAGLSSFLTSLASYRNRPGHLAVALLTSMCLTMANIAAFYLATKAVGGSISFSQAIIIFSLGVGGTAATPTPGGLGGFEAGLAIGLVAYKIPNSQALAAALLFRLVSFWLPLLLSSVAFYVVTKRRLLASGLPS